MICEHCEFIKPVEKLHGAARCEITHNLVGFNDKCEVPDRERHFTLAARMAGRLDGSGFVPSDFDVLVRTTLSRVASDANNKGLMAQFLILFERLGDDAIDAILEVVGEKEDRIAREAEAVVPLATLKEYTDAIAAVDDAMGRPEEDPGLFKAKELLVMARDKQYP